MGGYGGRPPVALPFAAGLRDACLYAVPQNLPLEFRENRQHAGHRPPTGRVPAAVLVNLDLFIASDTAVAHLAGALGVPVWMPLSTTPDWR
jgi:hypothetical protein